VTITETDKHYVIRVPPPQTNPMLHADLSSLPGRTHNADCTEWCVPRFQARAVRAIMRRHQSIPRKVNGRSSPLWDFQEGAIEFARMHPSTLLDMYMGTGKTRTAIEIIDLYRASRVLVCGPSAGGEWFGIWRDQLTQYATFAYDLHILNNRLSVKERANYLDAEAGLTATPARPQIFLVNYEAAWRSPLGAAILMCEWDVIICDEVHRLKSAGSRISRFFGKLTHLVPYRVGLSGTPTPHSILDSYGVYRFLMPSIFGTNYRNFERRYAIRDEYSHQITDYINAREWRAKYNLIRYHVPKEARQLDEPLYSHLPVALPDKLWRIYKGVEREFYAALDEGRSIDAPNVLVRYLRLQQIEAGYSEVDKEIVHLPGGEAKQQALLHFLEDFPSGERLAVFAVFREEIRQIVQAAKDAGRPVYQLTGDVKELPQWKATAGAVLAVTLGAGSEAIDLTTASYAMLYSLGPKLGQYEQAISRVNRHGQRCAPQVYVMVPEGPNGEPSIGRKIYFGLKNRRNLLDELIGGAR
jgi:superfamily II DNA or RNA helicase